MTPDTLAQQALESIDLDISHTELWSLSDRDVVWDTFEKSKSLSGGNELFFEHARACIERRIKEAEVLSFDAQKEGRWLHYYPDWAMFEDVAIEETNGFFGSGDCPPPAFWVHVKADILLSFIPQKYVEIAKVGVELCVTEHLIWSTDEDVTQLLSPLRDHLIKRVWRLFK